MIHQLSEATEWELDQLWHCKGDALIEELKTERLVLKGKLFEAGKSLVISMSHADRLRSKSQWQSLGDLIRCHDYDLERIADA